MKKSFRLAIEQIASGIVAPHLRRSGVKNTEYTAHKDGSCTVGANQALKDVIRALPSVEVLKEGVESITFRTNAMADYVYLNPPLYTEAEKAQMEAEKLARKANRMTRNSRLELLGADEADEEAEEEEYQEIDDIPDGE